MMIKDKPMQIQMLGKAGESIIRNFLADHGYTVKDSVDQYDSDKDFLATRNGTTYTVEVKTEQPYVYKDMISFAKNQLHKCLSVDFLFFVAVPPVMRPDYKHGGKIFFTLPKKDAPQYELYKTRDGKSKAGFKIEQESIRCVAKLTDEELSALSRHTVSNYKNGHGKA